MTAIDRREAMGIFGVAALAALGVPERSGAEVEKGGLIYRLPDLPYAYAALEPYLDEATLRVHHGKHHAGYVAGLNSTLEKLAKAREGKDFSQIQALSRDLAFHGSGHVLHSLYFANLSPQPSSPAGRLKTAIEADFGSVELLTEQLKAASKTAAGSGWGVMAHEPLGGRLIVMQIEKHENQILAGAIPLLVIDVWEHAYYLKYKNDRGKYIEEIMKVVDWKEVSRRYEIAVG